MRRNQMLFCHGLLFMMMTVFSMGATLVSENAPCTDAPVVSASLFKNGLALIVREVKVPAHGELVTIAADPKPVHGTFWIEFDDVVRVESREAVWTETRTVKDSHYDIVRALHALQGKRVTVFFGHEKLKGTIKTFTGLQASFVALKTDQGVELIDSQTISRVSCEDKDAEFTALESKNMEEKRRAILNFSFKLAGHERRLRFSYLCRGASWAPAYRFDLAGEKKGVLSFQGVIRNEILSFKNTHISLVSGFPALMFERIVSPLYRGQNLDVFLSTLSNLGYSGRPAAISQQVMSNFIMDGSDIPESGAAMQEMDSDMHVRPAGRVDLGVGDALQLELGRKETDLERVVEWSIPESRDQEGRYQNNWRRIQPGASPDELWDTLIVVNPFDFPMTTAPFTVYQQGQILSQNLSYWTAQGQKARIRSGRVLNIATEVKEQEIESSRKRIEIDGDDYQQSEIRCDISLVNRRPTLQKLVIKRSLWGRVHGLTGSGQKRQLAEGAQSQNPRTEVEWNLEMAPGQKMKIGFTYLVLTDI